MLALCGLLLLSGCAWPVRNETDQLVREMVEHPFDIAPEPTAPAPSSPAQVPTSDRASPPAAVSPPAPRTTSIAPNGAPAVTDGGKDAVLLTGTSSGARVVERASFLREVNNDRPSDKGPELAADSERPRVPLKDNEALAAAWTQPAPGTPPGQQRKLDLELSPRLPGSEAPRIVLPRDRQAAEGEIDELFPPLSPLPVEPKPQPGPDGKPYTLEDLQRLAAANNPTLVQAAADVEAARGAMIQAGTYPNPVFNYLQDTSNDNNIAGVQGANLDQLVITGGKLKLGTAAAQKNLDNAVLALKRARMDLATSVRTAYFTVLVDVETLIVTRALVQLSDDIYRLQTGLLKGAQTAPYEPTALRAQTNLNRLAYKQAIASYIYDWKALVATLGLPQLPLSEVAGQVDRFIPYFDYDRVRAHVLNNHTDILTARNTVTQAQYNLKLAQVTPLPNFDVNMGMERDFGDFPHGFWTPTALALAMPIWDQNKGGIIAAQGALVRASEESHRVEVNLTNNLALAYENYRNNLYSIDYFRRTILPDLVSYYRGIYARRQIDPNSAFGDLVFAQQNLSTNVQNYLNLLQSLWMSVVGVADFLQTDDLYQVAKRQDLPELPDFKNLQPPHWVCGHETVAASVTGNSGRDGAVSAQSMRPRHDLIQTVAWMQTQSGVNLPGFPQRKLDLEISPRLPGAEAPRIAFPRDPAEVDREIRRQFPELPPLPVEPKPQPGPNSQPYTLADLQRLAAANSPVLRQAASDVEAAKGNLLQAMTYTNPTIAYVQYPSNNNNTAASNGGFVDQPISTGGKVKLGVASAQMDLDNAVLALKRARMDLATAVRKAYFTILVDIQTLIVNRALAQLSDEIYRLQVGLLRGAQAAPYEPTALRAQAFTNRLAYKQAIAAYVYDWKALVATLGLPQLPLSEVAGEVDQFIPYYDYDQVRTYVLQNHTDVLTARNTLRQSQYNLKLAQVTPVFPDIDVNLGLQKDFANPPFGVYQTLVLGLPVPLWNQNKGNIIAAQSALVRASEESHRVEVTLTNALALAYEGYRNNLYAMEYYRRNVLPDLVRYYRGIYARRQIDPSSAFGDLVFAQQNLATNVQAYLGMLQSLWTSVVGVADFIQTDELYHFGKRHELPELPDFSQLQAPQWMCGHESQGGAR